MHERPHINRAGLSLISLAIALACIVVLTMQVRDRWNSPEVKTAAEAQTTTTGQAAVSYPMNRLWDPANTMLNKACVTSANVAGTMVSKCAALPATCGYLYCVAK